MFVVASFSNIFEFVKIDLSLSFCHIKFMFKIKQMTSKNYSFAASLANTMDWKMAPEDFEFMQWLEPEGCFVLLADTKHVGIATCVSFGKVGWFGNLIVEEKYRNKGAGSMLAKHAVDYLHGIGVETIGLYAYPDLVHLYDKMGFVRDEDFSVLHAEKVGLVAAEALPTIETAQVEAIEEFDSLCFGGNRKRLLESIILKEGNLNYYFSDSGAIAGYVAATVYEKDAWVGPLVCQQGEIEVAVVLAKAVLRKLVGKSVYAVIPREKKELLDTFFAAEFKEEFFVSRMFLGRVASKNCVYLAESLERG